MNIINRIKEAVFNQSRKKLIENTVIAIIIGVIAIIAGGSFLNGGKSEKAKDGSKKTVQVTDATQLYGFIPDETEEKLQKILANIQGVGKVEVMITYFETRENILAYDSKSIRNSTREEDNMGGTRNVSQEEFNNILVYEDSTAGGKKPVILKELEPKIKGVLIVAEGAGNVEVRERISSAVSVALNVPVHKIWVAQRRK